MIRRPPRSTLFPTRRSSDLTLCSPTVDAIGASDARTTQGDAGPKLYPQMHQDRSSLSRPCSARSPRDRSEEHTSELQSQSNLVCRLLLEKKKTIATTRRCST